MDEARAILDQLMGKTRNLTDDVKSKVREAHFSDSNVCKKYICGLCPHVLFNATKSDIGECSFEICGNIEADSCKKIWSNLSQKERDEYGYEWELLQCLQELVRQCDRKIERHKRRAEQVSAISDEDLRRLAEVEKLMYELTDQCEKAAEEGDVDRSMELLRKVDELRETAEGISNPKDDKKITVCEISGNFMSARDNDERMRAHFEGKQFLGWKMVREKLAELREKRLAPANSTHARRRDRDHDRDRDRESRDVVDRNVERDKDRERERERVDKKRKETLRSSSRDRLASGPTTTTAAPAPAQTCAPADSSHGQSSRHRRDREREREKERDRSRRRSRSSERPGARRRSRSRSRSREREDGPTHSGSKRRRGESEKDKAFLGSSASLKGETRDAGVENGLKDHDEVQASGNQDVQPSKEEPIQDDPPPELMSSLDSSEKVHLDPEGNDRSTRAVDSSSSSRRVPHADSRNRSGDHTRVRERERDHRERHKDRERDSGWVRERERGKEREGPSERSGYWDRRPTHEDRKQSESRDRDRDRTGRGVGPVPGYRGWEGEDAHVREAGAGFEQGWDHRHDRMEGFPMERRGERDRRRESERDFDREARQMDDVAPKPPAAPVSVIFPRSTFVDVEDGEEPEY